MRPLAHRPRWFVWLPLAGAALLVLGLATGLGLQRTTGPLVGVAEVGDGEANALGIGAVEEMLRFVEARYVDAVDRDALVDAAIANIFAELDPHSSFISAEQLRAHREQLDGTSTGIGVDVCVVRDSVTVVSALPGSPAAAAGLLPYDRLLAVGDVALGGGGVSAFDVETVLRGDPGEPVQLLVYRPGVGALQPVTVARAEVQVPSVAPGLLLGEDIAYLRIRQFSADTYREAMGQLETLTQERGARHLLLDLRGNSGGYLDEAVKLLSQLFPEEGKLMVYTEGAHSPRKEYTTSGRVFFPVEHVAVIIDQGTASASEIVAGAIQDWDRGTVVGRRSFGKGLVQELYPLKNGGALHITVSRYYTPSGRSIQRDYGDMGGYRTSAATDSAGGTRALPDRYVTALGRTVYGGGGIAPEVEVAARRSTDGARFAEARAHVAPFVFESVERLPADRTAEDLLPPLRDYLAGNGVRFADETWRGYAAELVNDLRYAIVEHREGEAAAAALRAEEDPFVRAGVDAIRGQRPVARQ